VCGRYTLIDSTTLPERFELPELATLPRPPISPRYNLAPGQGVPVVTGTGHGRMLLVMRWGFQPPWVREDPLRPWPINARAEGVVGNALFDHGIRQRRCLIPADGYYDWVFEDGRRRPLHVRLAGGGMFAFAGLFTGFRDRQDEFGTCVIVTTRANALIAPFGGRMPAILAPEDESRWLDPKLREPRAILPMLRPYPPEAMSLAPASRAVGSPLVDGPELLLPEMDTQPEA
jgi:putative SOS response-associated peptidase YedK